jgi:hypothetical protein
LLASGLILGATTPGVSEEKSASPMSFSGAEALPDAKPGECYAKVLLPAEYKTEMEQVVKREAYEKIEIVPAKYQVVTEQVLTKQAGEKLIPVAPEFQKSEERVEIAPARRAWRLSKNAKSKEADKSLVSGAFALGLPASAEVGQCYVEYFHPAEYKTETEIVVLREAHEGTEIVAPKYEMVEEQIVVKEASFKLVEVEPVYEKVTEKVLEAPAYTTWKTGRGPVQRIDHSTGDIMCLVEVPAKYKTITKQVLKSPAKTQKVEIPAQTKMQKVNKLVSPAQVKRIQIPAETETITKKVLAAEAKTVWQLEDQQGTGKRTGRMLCLHEVPAKHKVITKQVLKAPSTTKKLEIPAEYRKQQVRKLVSPAQEKRIQVPAEVDTLTRRVQVAAARLEWRPVLCETNMGRELNTQIQQALKSRGYNPGTVDGVIGRQTMIAVDQFQQKEKLPRGGLTLKTLTALGINVGTGQPSSNVRTRTRDQ